MPLHAKTPSKSGLRATSKSTPFKRGGKLAVKKSVPGQHQKPSAGVRPTAGNPIGKHHSFTEGTAAHIKNHAHVQSFNNAEQSEGKEIVQLHTKTSPKHPASPSMRAGGKGAPEYSSKGY